MCFNLQYAVNVFQSLFVCLVSHVLCQVEIRLYLFSQNESGSDTFIFSAYQYLYLIKHIGQINQNNINQFNWHSK